MGITLELSGRLLRTWTRPLVGLAKARPTLPRAALAAVLLLAVLPSGGLLAAAEPQADLFVSTHGSDAWSGRVAEPNAAQTDGPLATLDRARHLVRELKRADAGRQRPIVVAVRGGTYFLAQPLEFGPEDSGTPRAPIVYQAYGRERPVLSGGVQLEGWTVQPDGRWQTTLAAVRSGKWSFAQLFVNDQRRSAAAAAQAGLLPHRRRAAPQPAARKARVTTASATRATSCGPTGPTCDDVEVLAFHEWTASRMRIAPVDPAAARRPLHRHHPRPEPLGGLPQGLPLPGGERAARPWASRASGISIGPADG